jgi:hypothetical protein
VAAGGIRLDQPAAVTLAASTPPEPTTRTN